MLKPPSLDPPPFALLKARVVRGARAEGDQQGLNKCYV